MLNDLLLFIFNDFHLFLLLIFALSSYDLICTYDY